MVVQAMSVAVVVIGSVRLVLDWVSVTRWSGHGLREEGSIVPTIATMKMTRGYGNIPRPGRL